ncbi:MAG: hypothetical protein Q4F27_04805, partial [Desulfovibrionaceae bacterium]|nr:hypothetical protein [Desulfovibrionaceae bacterium]
GTAVAPAAPAGQDAPAAAVPGSSMDREAVAAIVRDELQKQLGPVKQSLTALQNREPGMVEIFGGIGWIVGLAGMAMLVANRRRQG